MKKKRGLWFSAAVISGWTIAFFWVQIMPRSPLPFPIPLGRLMIDALYIYNWDNYSADTGNTDQRAVQCCLQIWITQAATRCKIILIKPAICLHLAADDAQCLYSFFPLWEGSFFFKSDFFSVSLFSGDRRFFFSFPSFWLIIFSYSSGSVFSL